MLKITVEGVYESDIGSGQKKYENFNYTFELSREKEEGVDTHVLRRIVPYLISKDKNKAKVPCSRIKSYLITNVEKLDKKSTLLGKDILELSEWETQDLACLFDLYEAPIAGKMSIVSLRYKTAEAYLKKVLKVPMKTALEKANLEFYKQLPDGTFKLDFGNEKLLVNIPDGYFEKEEEKKKEKRSLSFFQKAGQAVANAVLSATGNQTIPPATPNGQQAPQQGQGRPQGQQGGFPSIKDFTK